MSNYLCDYKGISYKILKKYFIDIEKIFKYGDNIIPIFKYGKFFKRVGSHIILVQKQYILDSLIYGKYNLELKNTIDEILKRKKIISGKEYFVLIDNKNDQAREVVDYIIDNNIETKIYILSDDNMYWFFHDMGHSYLSNISYNFYENVYGYPEQLVNIFASIKLKQYGFYNYNNIIEQVIDKCYLYSSKDKEYFISNLIKLNFKDDI